MPTLEHSGTYALLPDTPTPESYVQKLENAWQEEKQGNAGMLHRTRCEVARRAVSEADLPMADYQLLNDRIASIEDWLTEQDRWCAPYK